jgi:hypothetical protein
MYISRTTSILSVSIFIALSAHFSTHLAIDIPRCSATHNTRHRSDHPQVSGIAGSGFGMFTPEPDKEFLVEHCQQRIDKLEGERSVVRSRIFQDFQAEEDDRQAKLEDERELAEIAQFRERDPQAAAKYTDVHDRLIAAAQEREARRNGVSAERSGGPDYRMLEKWSRRAADSYQEDYLVAEIGRNKLLIKLHELEAKHEDMKRRYTAALNEKIELLRECAVCAVFTLRWLADILAVPESATSTCRSTSQCRRLSRWIQLLWIHCCSQRHLKTDAARMRTSLV